MSEIPSNIICFTCESNFATSYLPFTLYTCPSCPDKTPYCEKCVKIISKILSPIHFKCFSCGEIRKAKQKDEISINEQSINEPYETENYKTPSKRNLIFNDFIPTSSETFQTNEEEEVKDTNDVSLLTENFGRCISLGNEEEKMQRIPEMSSDGFLTRSKISSKSKFLQHKGNNELLNKFKLLSSKKKSTLNGLKLDFGTLSLKSKRKNYPQTTRKIMPKDIFGCGGNYVIPEEVETELPQNSIFSSTSVKKLTLSKDMDLLNGGMNGSTNIPGIF